jgi:rubrerythrin
LRGIACGGLSLALVGGVGLPISAFAASNSQGEHSGTMKEQRQEFRSIREKMLSQAKADDAALEKLIGQLNNAPESQRADLEATILNKLVQQHHQMLSDWEALHAKMAQFRKEHFETTSTSTCGHCGTMGQKNTTAQK